MPLFTRSISALVLSLGGLAGCDEMAVADDPAALAELRTHKSCIAAVEQHTGISGGTINRTIPIVETNQYIVDLPGGAPKWTCYTDAEGKARELILTRLGTSAG